MTGKQKRQFDEAFLSAFSSYQELKRMLDYIDIDLDSFSNKLRNMQDIVADIRDYAERNNRLDEIIEAALDEVPTNIMLQEINTAFIKSSKKADNQNIAKTSNKVNNKGEKNAIIQGLNTGGGNVTINIGGDSSEKEETPEAYYRKKYANYTEDEANAELKEVQKEIDELEQNNKKSEHLENPEIRFLTANPTGSYSVDPGGQLTQIQKSGFDVKPQMNTPYNKVGELMKDYLHIHITVHGKKDELFFEYDKIEGKEAGVKIDSLVYLIKESAPIIKELIVIVACQSAEIAERLVHENICNAALGTTIDISPRAAVEFTGVFYEKLKQKGKIDTAFTSACIELNMDPYRETYDNEDPYDYSQVFKLYLQQ